MIFVKREAKMKKQVHDKLREMEEKRKEIDRKRESAYLRELKEKRRKELDEEGTRPTTSGLKRKKGKEKSATEEKAGKEKRREKTLAEKKMERIPCIKKKVKGGKKKKAPVEDGPLALEDNTTTSNFVKGKDAKERKYNLWLC